jgi:hypothetical protein
MRTRASLAQRLPSAPSTPLIRDQEWGSWLQVVGVGAWRSSARNAPGPFATLLQLRAQCQPPIHCPPSAREPVDDSVAHVESEHRATVCQQHTNHASEQPHHHHQHHQQTKRDPRAGTNPHTTLPAAACSTPALLMQMCSPATAPRSIIISHRRVAEHPVVAEHGS